jgi:hypothetical protein
VANATVTVKASGGDYTTLNAALAGEAADLTANCHSTGGAGILTIECYNLGSSTADTTKASTGTGYTTSSSYYINIIGAASEKTSSNTGKLSTERYRLDGTGNPMLSLLEDYTRCTDIQVKTTSSVAVYPSATSVRCERVIVYGSNRHGFNQDLDKTATIINCLVYNCGRHGYSAAAGTITCYNCTAVDTGYDGFTASGTIVATNCLAWDCGDGSTYFDFGGAGTKTLNYCLSKDTTADDFGGTGNVANSTDDPFVNYASDDFHIAVGSAPIGAGDDLSGTFTTDIDGDTRSSWDIGADEYVAAGGDPEGSLIHGKLLRGGLLMHGVLIGG